MPRGSETPENRSEKTSVVSPKPGMEPESWKDTAAGETQGARALAEAHGWGSLGPLRGTWASTHTSRRQAG